MLPPKQHFTIEFTNDTIRQWLHGFDSGREEHDGNLFLMQVEGT